MTAIKISLNSWDITTGEETVGAITRISPAEGEIKFNSELYGYRVYGPFGQGYNIGLISGGAEIGTVSYCWREGAIITTKNPENELDFRSGSLFRGGRKIGNGFSKDDNVLIKLEENPDEHQTTVIALLMALDVMYAERVGVFLRGLK
ncbi:MAG: hypothetical protein PHP95_17365 [Desulfuromonadaceae bacterium]|nr:hypothetical protein [Desulfuromonadaceae bacterium]MDD2850217.1 hypothetical protein [Desulfuromonadaceae bacterium]